MYVMIATLSWERCKGTLHSRTKRVNARRSSDSTGKSWVHDESWWEMLKHIWRGWWGLRVFYFVTRRNTGVCYARTTKVAFQLRRQVARWVVKVLDVLVAPQFQYLKQQQQQHLAHLSASLMLARGQCRPVCISFAVRVFVFSAENSAN